MSLRSAIRGRRDLQLWRSALEELRLGKDVRLHPGALSVRHGDGARVTIGAGSIVEGCLVVERANSEVHVGERSFIGGRSILDAACRIEVGDDVLISFDVVIFDHDSHSLHLADRVDDVRLWRSGQKDWSHVPISPVHVEDGCWIGARAMILKGVTVGQGAVVAAGSVVTRDVPAWSVVAGNPARQIRQLKVSAKEVTL